MKDIIRLSYGKIIKFFIYWKFLRENESWVKFEKKKKKKKKNIGSYIIYSNKGIFNK